MGGGRGRKTTSLGSGYTKNVYERAFMPAKLSYEEQLGMVQAYQQGLNLKRVASKFCRCTATVRRVLVEFDQPIRRAIQVVPVYMPTPEQIARDAKIIRRGWTKRQMAESIVGTDHGPATERTTEVFSDCVR